MKKARPQILLLAVAFIAAYFVVRNIPVPQCELAHYADYINDEGVVEACGDEETFFFDLEELVYPIEAVIEPMGPVVQGEPTDFLLKLSTVHGKPISPEDLAVTHTELIHMMAVDPSLEDYHHIHPQATGMPGVWQFGMTPEKAGNYRFYFDFVTLHGARRTLTMTELLVPGEAMPPALADVTEVVEVAGVPFILEASGSTLNATEEGMITLRTTNKKFLESVDLEMVMGSFAHVVAFDPNRKGFAHLHPLTPIIPDQETHKPEMTFSFYPQKAGTYRFWAQIKLNGQEHFLPFDLKVEEG